MYKTKLIHCCDVVPNLVVEIEIFNFCLFVCLLVWDILAQLPRRSMGYSCTVTGGVLKFFDICLFVCLLV